MKYDIHNPTPAARVIYDGIEPKEDIEGRGRQREIFVASGDTKRGVELSDVVAQELIARTRGNGNHDKDLQLTPIEQPKQLTPIEQPKQPEPEIKPEPTQTLSLKKK